ncbi:MAG: heme ABC transporter ATP-binding protein [Cellvibrionaceae bacterium]|nr:heme ABC transporter ATP-binding protein [Cellvibrionaceae bacterium]
MATLEVKQLSVQVAGSKLLNNISFALQPGDICAVVGPNGAGKSSLLAAIVGDLKLSGGSVAIAGSEARAKCLAFLPQFSLLNFPFTVSEVVALGRIPHSTGNAIDQHISTAAMAAMDISELADRPYTQLSGGEKQRTQLARVMSQIWRAEDAAQRLLLLDEPTTALDLGHQQQLMAALEKFAQCGVAVLMVVHDINIAAKYASHLLAIADGHCLAQGETTKILSEQLLQQLFNANLKLYIDPASQRPSVIL